jgi:hypothetical protein
MLDLPPRPSASSRELLQPKKPISLASAPSWFCFVVTNRLLFHQHHHVSKELYRIFHPEDGKKVKDKEEDKKVSSLRDLVSTDTCCRVARNGKHC